MQILVLLRWAVGLESLFPAALQVANGGQKGTRAGQRG